MEPAGYRLDGSGALDGANAMRQYLLVGLLVLVLQAAAIFLVGPYRQLLMSIGGLFGPAIDIADIPDLVLGGAALVTGVLLVLGFATVYLVRRASRRLTGA